MMAKPKFTDADPSIEFLFDESKRLRLQADRMLQETAIIDTYKKYISVNKIGGSYEYDLMIYPDIDLEIPVQPIEHHIFVALISDLAASKYIQKITVNDLVNFSAQGMWKDGYFIGVTIPFGDDIWGIDCWIQVSGKKVYNPENYVQKLNVCTQEQKNAILRIKYQLIYQSLYGTKFTSADVYDAVLDNNIRTTDAFLRLKEK